MSELSSPKTTSEQNSCATHVALLAPVPLKHLIDGQEACEKRHHHTVAFGSMNWGLFEKLEALRGMLCIDVFIYASRSDELTHTATWHARYVGRAEALADGTHPRGERYRPESCAGEAGWAIYWEVMDLKRLDPPIPLSDFRALESGENYKPTYLPEGPVLIEHPGAR